MSLKFQSRGAASPGTKAGLVKSKMTGNAKFVFPADLPETYRMVIFAKRYRYNRASGAQKDTVSTYNLPIPDGIVDQTQLQYQNKRLIKYAILLKKIILQIYRISQEHIVVK